MGCGKQQTPNLVSDNTVQQDSVVNSNIINSKEFIIFIEKSGYIITTSKINGEGVLNGNITRLNINGDNLAIYEYESNKEMEEDAKTISDDGYMTGKGIYNWKAKPHFYKGGTIIVIYFGDSEEITEKIEGFMGQQFAGAK